MLKSIRKFKKNMAKSHKTCMEQAKIIDTFGTYQRASRGLGKRERKRFGEGSEADWWGLDVITERGRGTQQRSSPAARFLRRGGTTAGVEWSNGWRRLLIRPKRIYNFCLLHACFV